ncbi:type VI secretion system protein TssA [Burkholderia contaminans]|uniref:type VI secretion system protein TssA n=1 Tax=Burkholderia contaminans TaxID=488447 RepID=UPI001CF56BA0|nr:type VI secretion system protein TssA [Burkholderia contaminans]MCA7918763.1 type VI secretion system protein TssA [Burkholderia contaminans]UUX35760.1 type VI secretion system protein TssA [Burkholderia contaminans]
MVTQAANLELNALLEPIDDRQPAGCFSEEDELFQGIEHEMVKLGGLHSASIDWRYVEDSARQYLSAQCKHFRVAGHWIAARLTQRTWHGWADSAALLAGMIDRYWQDGYPKPGPTGYPTKRKLVALQLDRLREALDRLGAGTFATEHRDAAQEALDRLHACAEAVKLDVETLARLEAGFSRQVEAARFPDAAASTASRTDPLEAISEAFFSTDKVTLSNEREQRRSLLATAEIINRQDAYDPTGYTLRRFALWAHLTTPPPALKDQRTELMAVPVSTVEGYRNALSANSVNPALLERVEKSVTSSPYWIEGSWIAASIARHLEMPQVAEAIRDRTEHFLLRLPGLLALRFSDGRPFVDDETQTWISSSSQSSPTGAMHDIHALRDELTTQLGHSGGIERLLHRLDELQRESTSLRERCHLTAIAADLLRDLGLSWLATSLFTQAHDLMRSATMEQWEPTLFNHLAKQQASLPIAAESGRRP